MFQSLVPTITSTLITLIISIILTQTPCQCDKIRAVDPTAGSSSPEVTVNLFAKWKYTPIHLEASEILASVDSDHFWNFIKSVHERSNGSNSWRSLNYEQQYKATIDLAEETLGETYQLPLLKFSLAQHISSPAIAAHDQIAHDRLGSKIHECEAFLEFPQPAIPEGTRSNDSNDFYGTKNLHSNVNIFCNKDDAALVFEKILSSPDYIEEYFQPTIYKSDHIYYAHNNQKAKKFKIMTAILYGEIGSPSFVDLYDYCKMMADMGKMNFVVRHLVLDQGVGDIGTNKNRISLGGYGVELAIKSTEYRAQDDTKVRGEARKLPDEAFILNEKPEDIEDLIFEELIEAGWKPTNPSFHEQILESVKQIPTINSSDIEDLSFQAVNLVLMAPQDRRLALMRDISQNFPILAKSISGETVREQ